MENLILVPNLIFYSFFSVLLGKLKHLCRRMAFPGIRTPRQAGPPQTAPCGPVKLNVSISTQLHSPSPLCWPMYARRKARANRSSVWVWSHCWKTLKQVFQKIAFLLQPLSTYHFRLEITEDFSELSGRRDERRKMTGNSQAFDLSTGSNLERTGVLC